MQENAEQIDTKEINLSQIFQNKPSIISQEPDQKKENESPKKEKQQPKSKELTKTDKPVENDKNKDDDSDDQDILEDDKEEKESAKENFNHKAELEAAQKKLKDTQKWGNDAHRKLSNYHRKVQKLKEESVLTEEEAKDLLDYVEDQQETKREKTSLERWGEVWDKEIEYMRKYSSNPEETNRNVWAFQHFIQNAPKEEIREAFEQFEALEEEKDEIAFTKKMLEIGKQWNEDIFNDIVEAGSLRNLKTHYSEKEKKLQNRLDKALKEIDKLKKKYEDYSENPQMGLPTGSSSNNHSQEHDFDLGRIFSSQNRFKPRQ